MTNVLGTVASASQLVDYTLRISSSIVTLCRSAHDAPQKYEGYRSHVQQLKEIATVIRYESPTDHALWTSVQATLLEAQSLDTDLQVAVRLVGRRSVSSLKESITDSQARAISHGLESLKSCVENLQLALSFAQLSHLREIQRSIEDLRCDPAAPMPITGNEFASLRISENASVSNGDFIDLEDETSSSRVPSRSTYSFISIDSSTVHNGNTIVGQKNPSQNYFKEIEIKGGRVRNGNFVGRRALDFEERFFTGAH